MSHIIVSAHFDGERVVLDEPLDLQPDTPLVVTVIDAEGERSAWNQFAAAQLERAYGPDEPEYGMDSVRELNPEYAGG